MIKIITVLLLATFLAGCNKNSWVDVSIQTHEDKENGVKCYYTNTVEDTAISCLKVK